MNRGETVAIIGTGRMGQGLSLALQGARVAVRLLDRSRRPEDTRQASLVLIAVPDDAIAGVAADLARAEAVGPQHVVLHLSGLLDRLALDVLTATGAALGSFHPLQSVADPTSAADRLRGAFAGLEGDDRALAAGEHLAEVLGMRAVRLAPGAKAAYHAGAVFASNYAVSLASIAERLARAAGVDPGTAREMYLPLLSGTVANLTHGPVAALTGPVRRGDAASIRRHLAVLAPADRALYRTLGLVALRLARQGGLGTEAAAEVERALNDEP